MTLWMVILGALVGCGSSTPETDAEAPAASARAKQKQKRKARKLEARRRAKAKGPQMPPVGAPGDVMGTLVLTPVEAQAPRVADDGTVVEAPTRTRAELKLRWGTDGQKTVPLGKVRGACAEVEPLPIGPPGKERKPLWAVRCEDTAGTIDLFIVQIGQRVTMFREDAGDAPDAPTNLKAVRRIPLVEGATLERES